MVTDNLERCVLSSFLFANTLCDKEERFAYTLDPNMFTTPFRRRVAEKINEETEGEQAYQVLSVVLEEKVAGTKHELEMIEILGATPLDIKSSKRVYDEIVQIRKIEAARGIL